MNVTIVNPFVEVAEATQVTPAPETPDAGGLFALLLASLAAPAQEKPDAETEAATLVVEAATEDEATEGSEDAAPETEAPTWLPEGLVALPAPLLQSVPKSEAALTVEASVAPVNATAPAATTAATLAESTVVVNAAPEQVTKAAAPVATAEVEAPVPVATALAEAEVETAAPVTSRPTPSQVDKSVQPEEVIDESLTAKLVRPEPEVETSHKAQVREAAAKAVVAAEAEAAPEPQPQPALPPAKDLLVKLAEANAVVSREAQDSTTLALRSEREAATTETSGSGTDEAPAITRAEPQLVAKEPTFLKAVSSASSAQQPAPIDVPAANLDRFMQHSVKQMLDAGEQRMRIHVTPPSLGELQIEVTRSGGEVQVQLTPSTQAVRDLLDGHAHQLREALMREGFDAAKVQVTQPSSSGGLNLNFSGAGQGHEAQQRQHGGQPAWNAPRYGAPDAQAPAAPSRAVYAAGGGDALNITV